VLGGTGGGAGVFGMAMVIECKDAGKVKALIAEEFALINEIIQTVLAKKEKDFESLKFEYKKGTDKAGALQVDSIEILHKELAEMKPKDKEDLVKVFSEDRIRLLVACPDAKTVVMTFGGGPTFLGKALKAAGPGGGLAADPNMAAALKNLPSNRVFTMAFSLKNLFTLLKSIETKMGEKMDIPEKLDLKCDVPVVMGATAEGCTVRSVIFAPIEMIKDIMQMATLREEEEKAAPDSTEPAPPPKSF
jgi:hypothetical protein